MIKRYRNPIISKIWDFQNQLVVWTTIEKLVLEGWFKANIISTADWKKLQNITAPTVKAVAEFENQTNHQMIGFLAALGQDLGPERKWIHYGLTSNDILDTSQSYLCKQSCAVVLQQLQILITQLTQRAHKNKDILMIGRTHGQYAEPITVGLFFARFVAQFERHVKRFKIAQTQIAVAKIAGATGTYTHLPLSIEKLVAQKLVLQPALISTQIAPRDNLIALFHAGANLITTLESLAIDLRNGQRNEINEFQEAFSNHQQGSSAMPHKMNPITLENICGLARILRGQVTSIYSTNLLWNERDLTNSSIERVLIPDFFHLLTTSLVKMITVIENLNINYAQIKTNLIHAQNIYSQKLLLTLIRKTNLDRQAAYKLVQNAVFKAHQTKQKLLLVLKNHPISQYLSVQEMEQCLDLKYLKPKVAEIFAKIFDHD